MKTLTALATYATGLAVAFAFVYIMVKSLLF